MYPSDKQLWWLVLPGLLVAAAAAIYLRFRSKKVHEHTGRRSLKMAAVSLENATVTCLLLLRQKSWKRERRSK